MKVCPGVILTAFVLFVSNVTDVAAARTGWFYAIVVGVTDYTEDLKPEDDKPLMLHVAAERMNHALHSVALKMGYDEDKIIIVQLDDKHSFDEKPIPSNILRRMDIAARNTFEKYDTLVFYFTGHGSSDGEDMYFHASGSNGVQEYFQVKYSDIKKFFKRSRAGMKLMFIDTCQSRKSFDSMTSPPSAVNEDVAKAALPDGTVTFFSSSDNQRSYIDWDVGYGYYTKHLLTALSGDADGWTDSGFVQSEKDGVLYAEELRDYMWIGVRRDLRQRKANNLAVQDPIANISTSIGRFKLFTFATVAVETSGTDQLSRPSGLYPISTLPRGTRLVRNALNVVTDDTGEIVDDGSYPVDFERDVEGACLERDIGPMVRLTWDSLTVFCPQ